MAKSKVTTVEEAIKTYCFDGMTVLLPGFVNVGVSEVLIEGLIEAGIKDISVNRRRANRADRLHRPTDQGCNSSTYFASYIGKF